VPADSRRPGARVRHAPSPKLWAADGSCPLLRCDSSRDPDAPLGGKAPDSTGGQACWWAQGGLPRPGCDLQLQGMPSRPCPDSLAARGRASWRKEEKGSPAGAGSCASLVPRLSLQRRSAPVTSSSTSTSEESHRTRKDPPSYGERQGPACLFPTLWALRHNFHASKTLRWVSRGKGLAADPCTTPTTSRDGPFPEAIVARPAAPMGDERKRPYQWRGARDRHWVPRILDG